MANNCLVTKLKDAVNNSDLERLGCIKLIMAPNTGSGVAQLNIGISGTKAVIVGDGQFTNSTGQENKGKETTSTNGSLYFKDIVDGDVCYVYNKYNLKSFIGDDGKIYLKNGAILDLSYCSMLTQIKFGNGNKPYFDFNSVSSKTPLNALTFLRSFSNNNLFGDVETVIENMISNGRTTGTLKFGVSGDNFKFHGVKFVTGVGTDYCLVQFNSATSVTVYKGETTSGDVLATYDGSTWTYQS